MEHLFDKILEQDEQIIKVIKPSKARYWKTLLFPFAIPLFWPHALVILVGSLGLALVFYAHGYKNLYYAYTNKRIIVRSGCIGVDFRSLDYKDITATSVDVGLLDKRSKTGMIFFKSPSASIALKYVVGPYELMKEIKGYMNGISPVTPADNAASETLPAQAAEKTEGEKIELLRKYKKLLDDGIITQEEFEQKKKDLL